MKHELCSWEISGALDVLVEDFHQPLTEDIIAKINAPLDMIQNVYNDKLREQIVEENRKKIPEMFSPCDYCAVWEYWRNDHEPCDYCLYKAQGN